MLKIKQLYTQILLTVVSLFVAITLVNCNGSGFEVADSCFNDGGDPLFSYAWHLANCGQKVFAKNGGTVGMDLNLRATWSSGLRGNGVKVRISDDGLDNVHEDLTGNFQTVVARSRDYISGDSNNSYKTTTAVPRDVVVGGTPYNDDHGTAVAGIVAAVAGNGKGGRGVAPKAALSIANFMSALTSTAESVLLNQADGNDFDISNMSWGIKQYQKTAVSANYEAQLKTGVTTFRNGRGAIYIKSGGNSYYEQCNGQPNDVCLGNSNFDGENVNPYQIMVGALTAQGYSANYSSPGANLWISGFGGMYGDSAPAILTTDRTGCVRGRSATNAGSSIAFENGGSGNSGCNYSVTFNGTSSAAPTVTGAVALLLEANPNLTWRDVKYILAKTALAVDYVTTGSIPYPGGTTANRGVPAGYSWELPWRVNGAGFKFQNWYGFGKVDIDAAVAMAKSYTSTFGTYTESTWISTGTINVAIPDNSLANAALSEIQILSGGNGALKIEAVRVRVSITHNDISQLALELTSPSGMRSILVNMNNSLLNVHDYSADVFLSNAFYGERSEGTWTLKVIDGHGDAVSGTLTNWQLQIIGAP
ncbi:S8 family peptidase [Bdellovibrio sp. HCB209]|uniref:S8 family peptidase n=1 Tax=Bdellovibrio sp. HCB209 TaxID=3394354 RepID=UPI0039B50443